MYTVELTAREMGGRVHQATIGNLRELLHSGRPMIVDFWAGWCAPCHALAPILRELAEEFDDRIIFAKVDVDNNRDLASQFKIKSLPTLILFKDGKEWDRFSGVKNRNELRKHLEKLSS
jgi:thioredoxin 1